MPYRINIDSVAREVARFSDEARESWAACLGEIAVDPHPRFGFYVERAVPIRGFPMRTWIYEISQETSISGQTVFVFTAEFFPFYSIVYLIDEAARDVVVVFLRENRRA